LKPILCVGEKLEENEAGKTTQVITSQLKAALIGIGNIRNVTIAYEPIWAIGTGRASTGRQANTTCGTLRAEIATMYNDTIAQDMRIIYGAA